MEFKGKKSYVNGSSKVIRASSGPTLVNDPFNARSNPSLERFLSEKMDFVSIISEMENSLLT